MPPDPSFGPMPATQPGLYPQTSYPPSVPTVNQNGQMNGSGYYAQPGQFFQPGGVGQASPYGQPTYERPRLPYGFSQANAYPRGPQDPYAWQRGAVNSARNPQIVQPEVAVQSGLPVQQGMQVAPPASLMTPPVFVQPPVNPYLAPQYAAQAYQMGPSLNPDQMAGGGYGMSPRALYAGQYGMRQPSRAGGGALRRILASPGKLIAVGSVAAVSLVLVVGVTILTARGSNQPSASVELGGATAPNGQSAEKLFQTAVTNALQTKSFSQKFNDDNLTIERKVDVSAVGSPRISGNAVIVDTGTEFESYAGRDDTYVKLSKAAMLANKPELAGKWVQVRKAGTLLDTGGTGGASLDMLFTPVTALYGSFIFGNYSSADRDALLGIIEDQLVYRFDPSLTSQVTVNGQAATQFKVTVSASGQQALSAKAQQLAGIDQQRIDRAATIARLSGGKNLELMVSVSNKAQRIVSVAGSGDGSSTISYDGFDATSVVRQQPQAEFLWDAYTNQVLGR